MAVLPHTMHVPPQTSPFLPSLLPLFQPPLPPGGHKGEMTVEVVPALWTLLQWPAPYEGQGRVIGAGRSFDRIEGASIGTGRHACRPGRDC